MAQVQERTEAVFNQCPATIGGLVEREQHIGFVRAALALHGQIEEDIRELQEELKKNERSAE